MSKDEPSYWCITDQNLPPQAPVSRQNFLACCRMRVDMDETRSSNDDVLPRYRMGKDHDHKKRVQ
jgi:hypothetical protein